MEQASCNPCRVNLNQKANSGGLEEHAERSQNEQDICRVVSPAVASIGGRYRTAAWVSVWSYATDQSREQLERCVSAASVCSGHQRCPRRQVPDELRAPGQEGRTACSKGFGYG